MTTRQNDLKEIFILDDIGDRILTITESSPNTFSLFFRGIISIRPRGAKHIKVLIDGQKE
jgi:hypothetical protein